MQRRPLIAGGLGALVVTRPSRAQAALRRVGFLGISSPAAASHLIEAFKQGMREFGWREGGNVEYRLVFAGSDESRLDGLAAELLGQRVEVIVASATVTVLAAQRATSAIPIVMTNIQNAVGLGLVQSLARPGGNITGISAQQEEVLGKLIQILHETVPRARRIAVLLSESNPGHGALWAAAERACAILKLSPLRVVASTPAELAGLLSYAADLEANFRYVAKFVDKILKGVTPADLPVEQPTKFQLVLNLKTAKTLGLKIPQTVMLRVDEVID